MGFESQNSNSTPTQYISIGVTQDEKKVITSRFFQLTKKNDNTGKYDKIPMVNGENKYPLPFYGYLKDIKVNLENKMMVQGQEKTLPKISFSFIDDENKRYVLDSSFFGDNGRINTNVSTLLNSLASIEKFGYLKLYITKTERKDAKGLFNFTLNVRNAVDWNPNLDKQTNFLRFQAPKDQTLPDETKVKWKFEYKDIPPLEIEEEVKGRKVTIKNDEEHQKFFIDLVDFINNNLNNTDYKVKTTQSAPVEQKLVTATKTEISKTPVTVSQPNSDEESFEPSDDDINDLPF